MQNSAQMILLSQKVIEEAINISLKNNHISNTFFASTALMAQIRKECLENIYTILQETDFSKYAELYVTLQEMIDERNQSFRDSGEDLTVNEYMFKINKCSQIISVNLLSHEVFKECNKDIEEYLQQEQQKKTDYRNSFVEFNDVKHQSIAHTEVLWAGWECDSLAWVIKQDNTNILLTTDHGEVKVTDKSFLESKIKEYEEAIENSKKMLALLS